MITVCSTMSGRVAPNLQCSRQEPGTDIDCTDTPAAGAHLMCERMDLAGPGFGDHFGMTTYARNFSDYRRLLAPVCDAHRMHAALHPRLPLQQG